jgi:hypothetical protein
MNRPAVHRAISEIRDCALIMLENASYLQSELKNVEMRKALRLQTAEVCDSMVCTKHDVISEIFEIDELLKSEIDWAVVSSRIDRLITWLWEDISKMHQLVMALREDSQKNQNYTLSLVLVQESAANIVNAFNYAKAAVDSLSSEKNEKGNA